MITKIGYLMFGFILGVLFYRRWLRDNNHDM
jgi:hypothetical protein